MTMTMGTTGGFAEPGVVGFTDPFPYTNLGGANVRRLTKNRIAGLSNKTCDFEPNANDIVAAHRAVYSNRQAPLNPRLLAAFHPGAGAGYANAETPGNARAATGVLTDITGKAIASPGDLSRVKAQAKSSAAGLITLNPGTGRNNDIFAQWLTLNDTDLGTLTKYLVRATDASNWIGIHRQSATNLRVERDVATAVATERDITIPATTPATGNAIGIRLSALTAQVFLNGVKLDDWTLNAAAQGLTGTLAGILIAAGAHVYAALDCFEVWSTTAVLGV